MAIENARSRLADLVLVMALLVPVGEVAAEEIRVSHDACRNLARYQPAPDVAYRPGVDARGRSVTPADLGPSRPLVLPDVVSFDINMDLKKYSQGGLANSPRMGSLEFSAGTVTVDVTTGQVTFDGQPLTDEDQALLAVECQKAFGGKP